MRKLVAVMWLVVCLLVVAVSTLAMVNNVAGVQDVYEESVHFVMWCLISVAAFTPAWIRGINLLYEGEKEEEVLKHKLYSNMLEQPSELDSLGHRATKKVFGGK